MHQIIKYSVYIGFIKSHILSCPELFNSTVHTIMTWNNSGRPPAAAALIAHSGLFKPDAANTANAENWQLSSFPFPSRKAANGTVSLFYSASFELRWLVVFLGSSLKTDQIKITGFLLILFLLLWKFSRAKQPVAAISCIIDVRQIRAALTHTRRIYCTSLQASSQVLKIHGNMDKARILRQWLMLNWYKRLWNVTRYFTFSLDVCRTNISPQTLGCKIKKGWQLAAYDDGWIRESVSVNEKWHFKDDLRLQDVFLLDFCAVFFTIISSLRKLHQ